MANPFYGAMGGGQPNMMQMVQQLKANPVQFLMNTKFKIPQNMMSDPNAIIQHLMNSGQVSQQQYEKARQIAAQFKR